MNAFLHSLFLTSSLTSGFSALITHTERWDSRSVFLCTVPAKAERVEEQTEKNGVPDLQARGEQIHCHSPAEDIWNYPSPHEGDEDSRDRNQDSSNRKHDDTTHINFLKKYNTLSLEQMGNPPINPSHTQLNRASI